MKKIFEEYVESMDYKVSVFFKELKAQIIKWFDEGSLAAQGCELDGEIQINNYNPMEKFLTCNFVESIVEGEEEENSLYRYRMVFMVRLDQMKGDEGGDDTVDYEEVPQEQQEEPQEETQEETQIGESVDNGLDINKVLLKIHQFDENNNEKGELVEEVDVEDIKEDFIIDKLGQLKDKSDDEGVDDINLKDDIYVK